MYVLVYDGEVVFFGSEYAVDQFIYENPCYDGVVDVLTYQEYFSL